MKLILKSVICAFIFACVISMSGFYGVCDDIQNEVFRLHIIANSDSPEDQALKIKVRDEMLSYTSEIFKGCKNKAESINAANTYLEDIKSHAQQIVYENGYNYKVDAYVTNMSFNTRVYDNFTLPAGKYDALRIVIGNGEGKNWWCVMYPSLCVGAARKNWWCVLYPALCIPSAQADDLGNVMNDSEQEIITNADRYEVKFKVVEWFESIFSFFG